MFGEQSSQPIQSQNNLDNQKKLVDDMMLSLLELWMPSGEAQLFECEEISSNSSTVIIDAKLYNTWIQGLYEVM